jgi:hypothetical protein
MWRRVTLVKPTFGRTYRLHYQGDKNRRARKNITSNSQWEQVAKRYWEVIGLRTQAEEEWSEDDKLEHVDADQVSAGSGCPAEVPAFILRHICGDNHLKQKNREYQREIKITCVVSLSPGEVVQVIHFLENTNIIEMLSASVLWLPRMSHWYARKVINRAYNNFKLTALRVIIEQETEQGKKQKS